MGNCFSSDSSQPKGKEMGKEQSKPATAKPKQKGKKDALENIEIKAKNTKVDPQDIEFGYKRNFHDEYEVSKLLGKGAFASAYQVTPRESSRFYGRCDLAVKVIAKSSLKTVQEVEWLRQEVDIMRLLGGSINIVHVYDCYESKNHVYILMELCSGGNLFEKIAKGDPYSEKMASMLMGDILRVAEQCHAKRIIHRDIKPENFLFGNKLVGAPLKMTDFGLADYCEPGQKLSEISGTPYYIAPEVIRQNYGLEADIWSCGIVMYVLLTGRTPFHRPDDHKQSYKVVFRRILDEEIDFNKDPWGNISDTAKDLCRKLLQKDPSKRLTANEALQHPWVKEDETTDARKAATVQRLQLFGTYSKFKQVVLYRIAKELALPEVCELKKTWDKMNFDNVEKMGTVRLLDGLELDGYTLGEREGSDLLKRIDVLNTGGLTFDEFSAAILDWTEIGEDKRYKQLCKQVFDDFDHKKDGVITADELAKELPGKYDEKELSKMVGEADTNGDNKIEFKEFVAFIHEKLGSADMFDKRLSSRYRNSFPKRTNSFLRKLNIDTNTNTESAESLTADTAKKSSSNETSKAKSIAPGIERQASLGRKQQERQEFQDF